MVPICNRRSRKRTPVFLCSFLETDNRETNSSQYYFKTILLNFQIFAEGMVVKFLIEISG